LTWGIAYVFKFSSNDIWEMDMDELQFWNDGAGVVSKWIGAK